MALDHPKDTTNHCLNLDTAPFQIPPHTSALALAAPHCRPPSSTSLLYSTIAFAPINIRTLKNPRSRCGYLPPITTFTPRGILTAPRRKTDVISYPVISNHCLILLIEDIKQPLHDPSYFKKIPANLTLYPAQPAAVPFQLKHRHNPPEPWPLPVPSSGQRHPLLPYPLKTNTSNQVMVSAQYIYSYVLGLPFETTHLSIFTPRHLPDEQKSLFV